MIQVIGGLIATLISYAALLKFLDSCIEWIFDVINLKNTGIIVSIQIWYAD
jgi:hypothetical protein